MMSKETVGFYGKLPIAGDFISRRLPKHFIKTLDQWIQNVMAISREQLGADWLDLYLTSPIWRFALPSGIICEEQGWIGLMMPSVDKVGRYFPLILAGKVIEPDYLPVLLVTHHDWFTQLEDIALAALEEQLTLEALNHELQSLAIPTWTNKVSSIEEDLILPSSSHLLAQQTLTDDLSTQEGLTLSALRVLTKQIDNYSIWLNPGQEDDRGVIKIFSNLPSGDDYIQMIG